MLFLQRNLDWMRLCTWEVTAVRSQVIVRMLEKNMGREDIVQGCNSVTLRHPASQAVVGPRNFLHLQQ